MIDVKFITDALGVPKNPKGVSVFKAIVSDSRKLKPGDLFVALVGETMDGHDFAKKALESGAAGVVVHKGFDELAQEFPYAQIFSVPDTLIAYRKLGHAWRMEFNIPVIAVVGSVGKTTSKEFLAAMLKGVYGEHTVHKTEGSQNGFIGIPITLLELTSEHKAAVIEVGIDEIGAMAQHMDCVSPTAVLLTAIGPEHLEKLIDLDIVTHEEMLAIEWAHARKLPVGINLDDPLIAKAAAHLKGSHVMTFSLRESDATIVGKYDPIHLTLKTVEGRSGSVMISMPLPGQHNAINALGAFAMGRSVHGKPSLLAMGLTKYFKGGVGRSQVVEIARGQNKIICDYYNANPSSVQAALSIINELFQSAKNPGQKMICLGDMLELGKDELQFHRDLAPFILKSGIDSVYLFGPKMKSLESSLKYLGYFGNLRHYENIDALSADLIRDLKPNDICLIKGSRSMKMERVWKAVHDHFGD